jgi:hypothetical protein
MTLQSEMKPSGHEGTEPVLPNYDLSLEKLGELQDELVAVVKTQVMEPGIVSVVVKPEHKFANIIRNHEATFFPEVKEVTAEEEITTEFMALVDTRPGAQSVVHGATINRPTTKENVPETGFYIIDALIEKGNFSKEQFYQYYQSQGVDVDNCVSVETNFIIGERAEKFKGFGTAMIVYLAIVQAYLEEQQTENIVGVFATLNGRQRSSFRQNGVEYELLMGEEEMETPEAEQGVETLPVFIPYSSQTESIFNSMGIKLPLVTF